MTITIVYLSGVIFFLLQAYRYARISWLRVRGALTWPLLLIILPQLVIYYRAATKQEEAKLRYDQRLGLRCVRIGGRNGDYMWGIGG